MKHTWKRLLRLCAMPMRAPLGGGCMGIKGVDG